MRASIGAKTRAAAVWIGKSATSCADRHPVTGNRLMTMSSTAQGRREMASLDICSAFEVPRQTRMAIHAADTLQ
jgi:hypothetical protein